MATRKNSSSTQQDVSQNLHVKAYDTILASGGVEAAYVGGSAVALSALLVTRKNDIAWSLGTFALSFFVAGGSREDSAIRDIALGGLGASAGALTLRFLGKLNRFPGQQ
jgi:hypothetical protein